MAMPRSPIIYTAQPFHNSLLGASGQLLWFPLHGGFTALDQEASFPYESILSGSAASDKWSARQGGYKFPVNNGSTDSVCIRVDHEDEETSSLDDVLALNTLSIGQELIIAWEAFFVDQASSVGAWWSYGRMSPRSVYGAQVPTNKTAQVLARGLDASTQEAVSYTWHEGETYNTLKNGPVFACVMSLQTTAALTSQTTLLLGRAGVSRGRGTATINWSNNGGTARPGRHDHPSGHRGLVIGNCLASTESSQRPIGAGSGNHAWIGNWQARRFTTYDSQRAEAVLADLIARPRDIARTMVSG